MSLGKKLKEAPLVSSAVWHVDHHFEVLHDVQRMQRESAGDLILAFEALERILIRLQEIAANTGKAAREETRKPLEDVSLALTRMDGQLGASVAALGTRLREGFARQGASAEQLSLNLAELRSELRLGLEQQTGQIQQQTGQIQQQTAQLQQHMTQQMEHALERILNPYGGIQADGLPHGDNEPEPLLLQFLAAELKAANAVDVGANEGRVSSLLLDAGLEVFALEPEPGTQEKLRAQLGARDRFHALGFAAGAQDGEAELHLVADTTEDKRYEAGLSLYSSLSKHELVEGLSFGESVRVPLRKLTTLASEGHIPREIGILKIDTEGCDLDVIQGLGELRPEIVQVEYWDPAFVFGASGSRNALSQTAPALRALGYHRHIVIGRVPSGTVVYYCNIPTSIPKSWGNAIFFREEASFQAARRWCDAVLTPAYLYR